jgi:hypothetical protein
MEQELSLLIFEKNELPVFSNLGKRLYSVCIIDNSIILLEALPEVYLAGGSYFKYLKEKNAKMCIVIGNGDKDQKIKDQYGNRIITYDVKEYDPKVDQKINIKSYNDVNTKKYKIVVKQYNRNDNELKPKALVR